MTNDFQDTKNKLCRPIYPIPTFFDSCEQVDYLAVEDYVEFLKRHGPLPVMVTAGTSRLNLLSNEELKKLNAAVTHAAHRGQHRQVAIAANPMSGPLSSSLDVAKHAEGIGADVFLVYYPERYYDDDTVVDYYREIASHTSLPLMIHGMPLRNATGGPPKPFDNTLCKKLSDIPQVIGIKEESLSEKVRYDIAKDLRDRLVITAAGESMRMFLSSAPFGVQSYLVGVGSMSPAVEEQFYRLYSDGRINDAASLVDATETPFFEVAKRVGWHIAMKAGLAASGLFQDHERKPLRAVTDHQRKQIVQVMQDIKLLTPGSENG